MSVKLSKKDNLNNVGVAFADATVRQFGVSEFVDNDLLSNTEVGFTLTAVKVKWMGSSVVSGSRSLFNLV